MTRPVFLAPPEILEEALPGQRLVLEGDEARHALQVRRLHAGEEIDLVDGAGRRVSGPITETSGSGATSRLSMTVTTVTQEPAPRPRLVLAQALAKGGRDEQAITMACEAGIDEVIPWQARHSIVRWQGARAAKGRARWEAALLAAVKQSRRAWLPPVGELHTSLAEVAARAVSGGGAALLLDEQAITPIAHAELPATDAQAPPAQVVLIVGPEGGISDEERRELITAGAQPVRLGPHVLRSGTAGVIATAVVSQQLGRWEPNTSSE